MIDNAIPHTDGAVPAQRGEANSSDIPLDRSRPRNHSRAHDGLNKLIHPRKSTESMRRSMSKYAQVVSQTAIRLTFKVREATNDGSLGSTEITQLHTWVTADLIPWAKSSADYVDDLTRSQVDALISELQELDAELSASIGSRAADIADRLRNTGSALVTTLVRDR